MARILAISSRVVRGQVGLDATVPALQYLGHEVWALQTVLLASRPGLGRLVRHDLPVDAFAGMLQALADDDCWPLLDAVFTGYFPSAGSVAAAADAIAGIRAARPGIPVMVDPILGDGGRLYVAPATAEAIRDRLLPLATIAVPNLFELQWLAGRPVHTAEEIAAAARALGPPTVIVTSAIESSTHVATLAVTASAERFERSTVKCAGIPNGAGDVLAGLLLGNLVRGTELSAALDASLSTLARVLAASERKAVLDLAAL